MRDGLSTDGAPTIGAVAHHDLVGLTSEPIADLAATAAARVASFRRCHSVSLTSNAKLGGALEWTVLGISCKAFPKRAAERRPLQRFVMTRGFKK